MHTIIQTAEQTEGPTTINRDESADETEVKDEGRVTTEMGAMCR